MYHEEYNAFIQLNLLRVYFVGGTEIGKGGPLLAAKISPGDRFWRGDRNFRYSTTAIMQMFITTNRSHVARFWKFLSPRGQQSSKIAYTRGSHSDQEPI